MVLLSLTTPDKARVPSRVAAAVGATYSTVEVAPAFVPMTVLTEAQGACVSTVKEYAALKLPSTLFCACTAAVTLCRPSGRAVPGLKDQELPLTTAAPNGLPDAKT